MSNSKSRYLDILLDQVTSTTTNTKVGNNNEIVIENREEMELEVISQHDDDATVELPKRLPIQTFAFFDIEASGLKCATSKARITELSIVALSVSELLKLEAKLGDVTAAENPEQVFARVQNKLTLCLNPTTIIMPEVADLTGLDNYNLENQSSFTFQTSQILQNFLLHLMKPICLVAHFGLGFDFPLLRAELERVGFVVQPEPSEAVWGSLGDLVVVDTLDAFKHIFAEKERLRVSRSRNCEVVFDDDDIFNFATLEEVPSSSDDQVFSYRETLEESQVPSATSTPVKNGPSTSTAFSTYHLPMTPPNTTSKKRRNNDLDLESGVSCSKKSLQVFDTHSPDEIREDNDATPDRSSMPPPALFQPAAPHKMRKFSAPPQRLAEASRARKRLDFSQTLPQSFSLSNLHQFFFGKQPNVSHGAEHDCLSLIRICAHEGSSFVRYAEENAVLFSSIEKMW